MANWTHYSSYHVYPHLGIYFGSPVGRYPTFHTLTSVGWKKSFSVWLKHGTAFSCCSENQSYKYLKNKGYLKQIQLK